MGKDSNERTKLELKRRALQNEKNKAYANYFALLNRVKQAQSTVDDARRKVQEAKREVAIDAERVGFTPPLLFRKEHRRFRSQLDISQAKLEQAQEQLTLAEAELIRLRSACDTAKAEFHNARDQYNRVIERFRSHQWRPDLNSDGIIRRVNMRLVEGNPNYLANLFGSDAEIVASVGGKKIDVFFGPEGNRRHAVINRGGNVSYPEG